MKYLERLDLIDKIGRELQSRMSYVEIDTYLTAIGIDTSKETSDNGGSKWVYAKDLLASESEKTILEIAEELEIEHGFVESLGKNITESGFWKPNHFRLFISHLAEHKLKMSQLQGVLKEYGISAFVAHEDIEPTKEWLGEIEKALFSMDALTAVLTPNFEKSKWTDQEVGVAVGREVLVIPIRKGMDPYGFIGKYQGMQGEGKSIGQVSKLLFEILANNPKTREKMAGALVNQVVSSVDPETAINKLGLVSGIKNLQKKYLERLRDDCKENTSLTGSKMFIESLNKSLSEKKIDKFVIDNVGADAFDDDIPF